MKCNFSTWILRDRVCVFWNVMPYNLINGKQNFEGMPWSGRQHNSPKLCYLHTNPHCVTYQKTKWTVTVLELNFGICIWSDEMRKEFVLTLIVPWAKLAVLCKVWMRTDRLPSGRGESQEALIVHVDITRI